MEIGELRLARALPPGERWRGRSVYPCLLQAILRDEGVRCWIGHEPDNATSARGILKAGFHRIGNIYRRPAGDLALVPVGPIGPGSRA